MSENLARKQTPAGMATCFLFAVGVGLVPQPVGVQTPEERLQERDEINRQLRSDSALQALAQRSIQRDADARLRQQQQRQQQENEQRRVKRRRMCN